MDLTIIYYTSNSISDHFSISVQNQLLKVVGSIPIISVSHKPMTFGENIVVDLPRHHLSIYRQALIGAKAAKTKYISLCEDDVLYSPEHFKHRSSPGKFLYNLGFWMLFTWGEPMFSQKISSRINLSNLICERELFIEAMEERFAKWPENVRLSIWAEPSKYERQLGVTIREKETFYANPPNILFSHQAGLGFQNLGMRKKYGEIRAFEVPYWGAAKNVAKLYDNYRQ